MYNIRIKSLPEGTRTGDQLNYALVDRNTLFLKPDTSVKNGVKNTMGAAPREEATIEAEGGETIVGDINQDGFIEHQFITGKKHSKGGVPLDIPNDPKNPPFIFSDTPKLKIKDPEVLKMFNMGGKVSGYTPATIAKKYPLNNFIDTIKNPKSDKVSRDTSAAMLDNNLQKLGILALVQEAMKGFPDGVPAIAESAMAMLSGGAPQGQLPQAKYGGPIYAKGGEKIPSSSKRVPADYDWSYWGDIKRGASSVVKEIEKKGLWDAATDYLRENQDATDRELARQRAEDNAAKAKPAVKKTTRTAQPFVSQPVDRNAPTNLVRGKVGTKGVDQGTIKSMIDLPDGTRRYIYKDNTYEDLDANGNFTGDRYKIGEGDIVRTEKRDNGAISYYDNEGGKVTVFKNNRAGFVNSKGKVTGKATLDKKNKQFIFDPTAQEANAFFSKAGMPNTNARLNLGQVQQGLIDSSGKSKKPVPKPAPWAPSQEQKTRASKIPRVGDVYYVNDKPVKITDIETDTLGDVLPNFMNKPSGIHYVDAQGNDFYTTPEEFKEIQNNGATTRYGRSSTSWMTADDNKKYVFGTKPMGTPSRDYEGAEWKAGEVLETPTGKYKIEDPQENIANMNPLISFAKLADPDSSIYNTMKVRNLKTNKTESLDYGDFIDQYKMGLATKSGMQPTFTDDSEEVAAGDVAAEAATTEFRDLTPRDSVQAAPVEVPVTETPAVDTNTTVVAPSTTVTPTPAPQRTIQRQQAAPKDSYDPSEVEQVYRQGGSLPRYQGAGQPPTTAAATTATPAVTTATTTPAQGELKVIRTKDGNYGLARVIKNPDGSVLRYDRVFTAFLGQRTTPGGANESWAGGPEKLATYVKMMQDNGVDLNDIKSGKDFQDKLYDYTLKTNPESILNMWELQGQTIHGSQDPTLRKELEQLGVKTTSSTTGPGYTIDMKHLSPEQKLEAAKVLKRGYTDDKVGVRTLGIQPGTPKIPEIPETPGTPEKPIVTQDIVPSQRITRKGPWYTPDVMNLALATGLRIPDLGPAMANFNYQVPGYVLEDPTRQLAANQEQQARMMEGLYGSTAGNVAGAGALSNYGESAAQAANVIAGVENRNVNTVNQAYANAAGIQNQAEQLNEQAKQQYLAQDATRIQGLANAYNARDARVVGAYNKGWDNRFKTNILERMFPQVAVDTIQGDIGWSGQGRDPSLPNLYVNPMTAGKTTGKNAGLPADYDPNEMNTYAGNLYEQTYNSVLGKMGKDAAADYAKRFTAATMSKYMNTPQSQKSGYQDFGANYNLDFS